MKCRAGAICALTRCDLLHWAEALSALHPPAAPGEQKTQAHPRTDLVNDTGFWRLRVSPLFYCCMLAFCTQLGFLGLALATERRKNPGKLGPHDCFRKVGSRFVSRAFAVDPAWHPGVLTGPGRWEGVGAWN